MGTEPQVTRKRNSGSDQLDNADTGLTYAEWARENGYDPETRTYRQAGSTGGAT